MNRAMHFLEKYIAGHISEKDLELLGKDEPIRVFVKRENKKATLLLKEGGHYLVRYDAPCGHGGSSSRDELRKLGYTEEYLDGHCYYIYREDFEVIEEGKSNGLD